MPKEDDNYQKILHASPATSEPSTPITIWVDTYLQRLDEYGNVWGLTDKEILFAFEKVQS
jgi:uncharacterized glyoxalase superfamily protein PhnB